MILLLQLFFLISIWMECTFPSPHFQFCMCPLIWSGSLVDSIYVDLFLSSIQPVYVFWLGPLICFISVESLSCVRLWDPMNHGTLPVPPCPSPTPGDYSNSCPLSRWCHLTISSSVVPFSSCLQSSPTSGSFQMSQLFGSGGQSTGASAFPVAYWAPTDLGSSSFSVLSFWLFILFMEFSRQEYWSGLPFPSPVPTFCQTSPPWPLCLGWPHTAWLSFIELDKLWSVWSDWLVVCDCGFSLSALWCSLSAYRLTWVSLTLDKGYLFMAASAKRSHCSLPWTWGSSSELLPLSLGVG